MNFCENCGSKIKKGSCVKCNKRIEGKKSIVKAETFNIKGVKGIVAINIAIAVIGGGIAYKTFEKRKQMEYEVEAVINLENEKFLEAKEVMENYKGDNKKILDLKEINNTYLEVENKFKDNDGDILNNFVVSFKDSEYWKYYEERVDGLKEVKEVLPKYIKDKNISKAKGIVDKCKKYKLSDVEKKEIEKVEKEIQVLEKEIEMDKKKNSYRERYNYLANKYHENYYSEYMRSSGKSQGEMGLHFSEVKKEWKNLFDDIWSYLPEILNEEEVQKIVDEQKRWEEENEESKKQLMSMGMSGSAFGTTNGSAEANQYKEKIKVLIDGYL